MQVELESHSHLSLLLAACHDADDPLFVRGQH
jgi:hypothetical protein